MNKILNIIITIIIIIIGGQNSVVSIATLYRLEAPGIESRWGRNFPHVSTRTVGPTQPFLQWIPSLLLGG